MTSPYTFGRGMATAMITIGWIVGGLVCTLLVVGSIYDARVPVARAVMIGAGIVGGFFIGSMNHGFWQAMIALFDIADNTRRQTELAEEHARPPRQVRPQPAPAPVSHNTVTPTDPLPPVKLPNGPRQGESEADWAKRIEREEAAAFKRRHP
jgi:hypothetical protein